MKLSRLQEILVFAALLSWQEIPLMAAEDQANAGQETTSADIGKADGSQDQGQESGASGGQSDADQASAGSPGDFQAYLRALNEKQRKELKEGWLRHKHAKEANGLVFLEFESALPASKGHLFIFPSWNATARLTPLAQAAADKGFDTFVFLPLPELEGHLPSSENSDEIAEIMDTFMNYAKAAVDTIGTHDTVNLLLCAGDNISWILSGVEAGTLFRPDGIIAYNAGYRDADSNSFTAMQLSTYRGFFAEIMTQESNGWLKDAVEKRQFMFKKKGRPARTVKQIRTDDPDELIKMFKGYLGKTRFAVKRKPRPAAK